MPNYVFWVGWNLFLAFIPVAIGHLMCRIVTRHAGKRGPALSIVLGTLGLFWLIFLPNTCYLLTEWRHLLATIEDASLYSRWTVGGDGWAMQQLMLHSLFYLAYSALGMLAFILAIRPVANLLRANGRKLWLPGIPFFPLVSLGVYLGLIRRFNSWDLFADPAAIWAATWHVATRPDLLFIILAFGGFLWLAYLVLDIWIDCVLVRWHRRREACVVDACLPCEHGG